MKKIVKPILKKNYYKMRLFWFFIFFYDTLSFNYKFNISVQCVKIQNFDNRIYEKNSIVKLEKWL